RAVGLDHSAPGRATSRRPRGPSRDRSPLVIAGLYALVDVPHAHGLEPAEVAAAVLGDRTLGGRDGASVVQLRAKSATTAERVKWARAMAEPCRAAGVPLVVDDDLAAALEAEA